MVEQQRGRRAIEIGPTGRTVATNIARLRERRGLTTRQLSAALERAGRSVPASGITRMEKAERVVTSDELAAFAIAFGVSPSALLLPLTDSPVEEVKVTAGGAVAAADAWGWANGQRPLKLTPGKEQTELLEHQLYSLPPWLRDPVGPLGDALRNLSTLRDPQVRTLLEQISGMSIGEPQPLPEKYRKPDVEGGDG